MDNTKPNIVIAGDQIYAGVDVNDVIPIPHSVVVQFSNADSYAAAISTGTIEADVFRDPNEQIVSTPDGMLIARKVIVEAKSVECPHCSETVDGLFLGDPRGKTCECSHCLKEFAIANDAALELK